MYHLATVYFVTDRQTDRQTDGITVTIADRQKIQTNGGGVV